MAAAEVVEYLTAQPGMSIYVTAAQATQPRARWRKVADHLRPRSRLMTAANLALKTKWHREQAEYHKACDKELAARLHELFDRIDILGFRAAHRVRVRRSLRSPSYVDRPAELITVLGPWIGQPGLIKSLVVDWVELAKLRAENPHLADKIDECIAHQPEHWRLDITPLP